MRKAIIIFTRVPSLGGSNTRLQKLLSKEKIQNVSIYLIEKTLAIARKLEADIKVYATPEDELDYLSQLIDFCDKEEILAQKGSDIGQRMYHAIQEVLADEYDQVILIGSDLYNLTVETIESGFQALEEYDVTIGPSIDGGYGLIGMKEPLSILFDMPAYSHSEVYHQLIEVCQNNHLTYYQLDFLRDIDTPEDIIKILTEDEEARFLAQGEYNANFIFDNQSKLLRIALGSQMHLPNQIKYEYDTLKVLELSGVTPRAHELVTYSPLLDCGYLVEEFLPGRPLEYDKDAHLAAELLAQIHNLDSDLASHLIVAGQPFQVMMDEFEQMFSYYQGSIHGNTMIERRIENLLNLLKDKFDLAEKIAEPSIINTELNSHNFLINEVGPSYIIDWEKPLIGDKEQDIAHFLAPTTTLWKTDYQFSHKEIEDFVEVYQQNSRKKLNIDKLNQYLLFTCLRGITWCSMAYVQYIEANKTYEYPQVFKIISSFLQEEFLEMIEEYFKERGYDIHG